MNSNEYKIYNNIVNLLKKNTNIIENNINIKLNTREILWNSLAPKIIVIGKNFDHFNKQAIEQGFNRLVTYVEVKYITDILDKIDNKEYLDDLLKSTYIRDFRLSDFGCHISHGICGEYLRKNNIKRALIFENDCQFYSYIEDSYLQKLINMYNLYNFDYLSLGSPTGRENIENTVCKNDLFSIHSFQNSLTHSYLINLNTAIILSNTLNINIKPTELLYIFNMQKRHWVKYNENENKSTNEDKINYEKYFRMGSDDFYCKYIKQYMLIQPLTYQKYIGNNKTILTRR